MIAHLPHASQPLVARDGKHPGTKLRFTAEGVQVEVNLDDGLLRHVFSLGLIGQQ